MSRKRTPIGQLDDELDAMGLAEPVENAPIAGIAPDGSLVVLVETQDSDELTADDVELLRTVARANETGKIAMYHERKELPEGQAAIAALRDLADRIEATL